MIGKITTPRGVRVEPLIYYLYGPGRHQEHTDPLSPPAGSIPPSWSPCCGRTERAISAS